MTKIVRTCEWPGKEASTVDFSRQNAQFFLRIRFNEPAAENSNVVPRPGNGKPTLVQSIGQMSASSVRIFPASQWDARKEPNR